MHVTPAVALLFAALLPACGPDGADAPADAPAREVAADPVAPPPRLRVPGGVATWTQAQRSTEPLPGSDGALTLAIGDITGGRVTVELATEDETLLAGVSLAPAGAAHFAVDGAAYELRLVALDNRLLGTDTARWSVVALDARGARPAGTVAAADGVSSPADGAGAHSSPDASAQAAAATEPELIEALIAAVEQLEGAVFIRNGDEHDATEAADHLRTKREWKADEIATAEDFIRVAATGSSLTGKPYVIRLADGTERPAADWFAERLAELRARR